MDFVIEFDLTTFEKPQALLSRRHPAPNVTKKLIVISSICSNVQSPKRIPEARTEEFHLPPHHRLMERDLRPLWMAVRGSMSSTRDVKNFLHGRTGRHLLEQSMLDRLALQDHLTVRHASR